jgi:hypothetical protein
MINFLSVILSFSIINAPIPANSFANYEDGSRNSNNLISTISNTDFYTKVSKPLIEKKRVEDEIKAEKIRQEKIAQEEKQEKIRQEYLRIRNARYQRQLKSKQTKKSTVSLAKQRPTTNTVVTSVPSGGVEGLICKWTSVYGGDCAYHIKIAKCESGLRTNASGGGGKFLGVFQQHRDYWPKRAARYGFAGASPLDANANIAVSIAMMRTMGYGHWSCA